MQVFDDRFQTVARSCNIDTSSAIVTAYNHFTRRERFYGDFKSTETTKRTYVCM
jgi:hypothetical protein